MTQANYTDLNPGSTINRVLLHAVAPNGTGFTTVPLEVTLNADGTGSLTITGGGGGSGNTVAATNAGTTATTANPIQGVTGGVAVPVSGTFWQSTQAVSAASLPLPSGASTAAKQPALGTAGTASTDVLSVQGIASMTALKVDGSAVTQPVSAASLPLPAGAATAAKQPALGTAGTPSSDVITVQGSSSATPAPVTNGGGTSAVTSVAASTTVATALSANTARRKWIVTNDTAVLMYVKIGTAASATSYTYALSAKGTTTGGGSCEGSDTTAITVILASGTGNALVTEVTA